MRRYSVNFGAAVNVAANTVTQEIGLVTGSTRVAQIYELIVGNIGSVADTQIRSDIFFASALTPGTGITPAVLEAGGTAAVTGASSTPTGVTTSGISLLALAFNARGTVRWLAGDPDSRILLAANGGTAGTVVLQNQQGGTASGLTLLNQLYFAE